jgi:hypothetical protein
MMDARQILEQIATRAVRSHAGVPGTAPVAAPFWTVIGAEAPAGFCQTPANADTSNPHAADSCSIAISTAPTAPELSEMLDGDSCVTVRHAPESEVAQVVDAWPKLPRSIRAGVLAMIETALLSG